MTLPEVWLRPNETSKVYARPQVPCRFMRARAYLRPGEEVSHLIELRGVRVGNLCVLHRLHSAMLSVVDLSQTGSPTLSVGQDLELELGLAPGVVGFDRPLQIIAFVEALVGPSQPDVAAARIAELERELAEQRHVSGQLELQVLALRELVNGQEVRLRQHEATEGELRRQLDDRAAWRAELEERRRNRPVRSAPARILVDLDVD